MNLFDSHSHLNDEKFDNDREKVIKEISNSKMEKLEQEIRKKQEENDEKTLEDMCKDSWKYIQNQSK